MSSLVCLLPGLGDALVAGPILRALHECNVEFDVLTMLAPVTAYARDLGYAREVIEADLLSLSPLALAKTLRLRQRRYGKVFVPFPAARWQYAAVAAVLGGKNAWIHRYGGLSSAIATHSRMHEVALRGGHRISENARLAEAAGFSVPELTYEMPKSWMGGSTCSGLLGIHPGSMRYKGNEQRRWPVEKFAELCSIQASQGRRVRIFLGPNEREDKSVLQQSCPSAEFVQGSLSQAARLIGECEVFLGNDSGLVHIAGGLGVKVLAIFGMTDPVRAQPLGKSRVIHPSNCPPCFDEGCKTFACVLNLDYKCIREDISVRFVSSEVDRAFSSDIAPNVPSESGPFKLYRRVPPTAVRL